MINIASSRRHVFGSAATVLLLAAFGSSAAFAGTAGDVPKLTNDGPPGRFETLPATGAPSTKKTAPATAPIVDPANPQHAAADAYYRCRLTTSEIKPYRVPIATRWWFSGPAKGDVNFCVQVGLGDWSAADSAPLTAIRISTEKPNGSFSALATSPVSLGGPLTASGKWPNKQWANDMKAAEVCSSTPIKQAELETLRLTLADRMPSNGGGSCTLYFGNVPRPPVSSGSPVGQPLTPPSKQ